MGRFWFRDGWGRCRVRRFRTKGLAVTVGFSSESGRSVKSRLHKKRHPKPDRNFHKQEAQVPKGAPNVYLHKEPVSTSSTLCWKSGPVPPTTICIPVSSASSIRLMDAILHHLGALKYCNSSDFRDLRWCKISSINSILKNSGLQRTACHIGGARLYV